MPYTTFKKSLHTYKPFRIGSNTKKSKTLIQIKVFHITKRNLFTNFYHLDFLSKRQVSFGYV